MPRKIKKSVSILLALVMLCGVLAVAPVAVSAEGDLQEYTTYNGGDVDSNGDPIIGKYTFDESNGVLTLKSGTFNGKAWQTGYRGSMNWRANNGFAAADVKKIVAESNVKFTGNCDLMFHKSFINCESIDLSNVDADVSSMTCMFCNCPKLSSLNISGFKTGSNTSLFYTFSDCPLLSSLNFSLEKFDTGNVKHMTHLFSGCSSLTSLDLSRFDTQKVENIDFIEL